MLRNCNIRADLLPLASEVIGIAILDTNDSSNSMQRYTCSAILNSNMKPRKLFVELSNFDQVGVS